MSFLFSSVLRGEGRDMSHEARRGCQPNAEGSMYTIPQRLTVAGCIAEGRREGGREERVKIKQLQSGNALI